MKAKIDFKREVVAIDKLKTDGDNPNVMTKKQKEALRKNIEKFGFIIPIITNKDYLIADGEQRYEIAKEMGLKEVPWYEKRDSISEYIHPTQKPVRLAERALKATNEKENIIIDLFGGSGSTLIACEQMGRRCYMMELDPKYCDVIVQRWEEFTGKKAIKEGENGNN